MSRVILRDATVLGRDGAVSGPKTVIVENGLISAVVSGLAADGQHAVGRAAGEPLRPLPGD
ncbi:MAG: hypothetical protein KKB59_03035, partial [Spirochaetes bacterium]|nr:hypothetical protein [Spirochaetota bacterium]